MKGFTLVELLIVLVVVGLLSVSASPLFFGTGSAEVDAVRQNTKSVLRNIQQSAMQNTNPGCQAAVIAREMIAEWAGDCEQAAYSGIQPSTREAATVTGLAEPSLEVSDGSISRSINASRFALLQFSNLGEPEDVAIYSRPLPTDPYQRQQALNPPIKIDFSLDGGPPLSLCINTTGYIYDC